MEQSDPPKKKRGRPRKYDKDGSCVISVSIESRQKKWLSEIADSSMSESTSALVRDALDLWYRVHVDGQSIDATDQKRYLVGEDRLLAQSWEQSPRAAESQRNEQDRSSMNLMDDSDPYDFGWV